MQSLQQIAEYVRLATGYDVDALRVKKRDTFRVAARQLFCYYGRLSRHSSSVIGAMVNIDHVTVLHSARRINEMKDTDIIIKNYINKYEAMSNKKQVFEINPPAHENRLEADELKGFECPTCAGRGWHFDYGERETRQIKCVRCAGTGRLRAWVTIEWEADK